VKPQCGLISLMGGPLIVTTEMLVGTCALPASALSSTPPQDALLGAMDLPYRKVFFPLGYSVEIVTNEPAVLCAAEESFGHAASSQRHTSLQVRVGVISGRSSVCPPEPVRRALDHMFLLVADPDNQALLDLRDGDNFTWITRAALGNRLYFRTNFLEKVVYLLLGASVVTDLHAACVGSNGKGILLCGPSGAGKSTLAYACARMGWTYTSDDTSYLMNDAPQPRVIGHCHRARFRPDARSLFPELAGRPVTPRMEGKPSIEVPIADLPVNLTSAETDIHAVVFLNRRAASSSNLIRLQPGAATHRMRRELYSVGEIRVRHEKILDAFWNVPAYELRYSELSEAVELLGHLTIEG
jgi:energy-coupling factor transporter ATP-binding protein EcfA2